LPAGDITKINSKEIPDFDVLVGGFPCQPFSSVGLRQGFDHKTQGTLFYEIERILKDKNPSAFLLENVKGLVSHQGGRTWRIIQESLGDLGYSFDARVQNSKYFGVPQSRERLFIVGFKAEDAFARFRFPEEDGEVPNVGDFLEEDVTGYSISRHLQQAYLFKLDDGRPQIVNASSSGAAKTLVASYHKIQRLTGTFVQGGETGIRLLSELECKSLMGFPASFKVPVSRTQMYRQFGNSVVVPHVRALAAAISSALA
jgi:DNA (cytosine-5)-methyltransferase 1